MPTNTNELVYDISKHRYYATVDGVKSKLNLDLELELKSTKEANVFLQQASDVLYNWLYGYIRKEAVRIVEYRIANNFDGDSVGFPYRDGMEEAIYAQIEYMFNYDGDMEAIKMGDFNKLVSVRSKHILHSYGISHRGHYGFHLSEEDYRSDY